MIATFLMLAVVIGWIAAPSIWDQIVAHLDHRRRLAMTRELKGLLKDGDELVRLAMLDKDMAADLHRRLGSELERVTTTRGARNTETD